MSAASAKPHEPSMEEILASIRRIIADDQDFGKADAGQPPAGETLDAEPTFSSSGSDTFTDEEAEADAPAAPHEEASEPSLHGLADLDVGVPDILFAEVPLPEPEPPPVAPPPAPIEPKIPPIPSRSDAWAAPRPASSAREEPLISSEATANVGSAFSLLSQTILSQNTRTLEDLVQELLKPMLKTWLDDNLPPLVERLVRAEIERVARGRR